MNDSIVRVRFLGEPEVMSSFAAFIQAKELFIWSSFTSRACFYLTEKNAQPVARTHLVRVLMVDDRQVDRVVSFLVTEIIGCAFMAGNLVLNSDD